MTNAIGIIWTSEQRELIADFQKRQSMLETEINKLRTLGSAGRTSGAQMQQGYRDAAAEMARLGSIAAKIQRETATPMQQHNDRLKDLRVLLKMGKIDQEQFAFAQQASLKTYYAESGMLDRLQKQKSEQVAMMKEGQRLTESVATDQERYNQKLAHYEQLLRAGAIDQQTFNRLLKTAREEYEKLLLAAVPIPEVMKEVNQEMGRLNSIAAKVHRDTISPLRAHAAGMKELRVLYHMGKISAQEFAIAQRQLRERLAESNVELMKVGKSSQSSIFSLRSLGGALGTGATAALGFVAAIRHIIQANREMAESATAAMEKQEELITRYRAQSGQSKEEIRAGKKDIYRAALKTSTTSDEAFGSATAMVSTGFEDQEVQKNALVPFLKLLKAQALDPKNATNPAEMAEAFSQFLTGSGQDKTGANVEKLAIAIQGLKESPIKMTDLRQLGKQAGTLKSLGNMSPEEMLSNFAFLRNTEVGEEAGTHMREIVRQLSTAAGNPKATEQLSLMGLTPQDVDFVGEDFATVMKRMREGVAKLPEEQRAVALDAIMEGRNISAFEMLSSHQDEVASLRGKMTNKEQFEQDFKTTTEGRLPMGNRYDVALEMVKAAKDSDSKNDRKDFELVLHKRGLAPAEISAGLKIYDTMDNTLGHDAHMEALASKDPQVRDTLRERRKKREADLKDAWEVIEDQQREKQEERKEKRQQAPEAPGQQQASNMPINVNVSVVMPGVGQKASPVPASGLQYVG